MKPAWAAAMGAFDFDEVGESRSQIWTLDRVDR